MSDTTCSSHNRALALCQRLIRKIKECPLDIVVFCLFLLAAPIMELLNRPFGYEPYNLHCWIDDKIPFIKEFIFVYHSWFPLLLLCGLYFYSHNRRLARHYFLAMFTAQLQACIIFPLYQTYVPRYDVGRLGNDLASTLVKATYIIDNHHCGAPSIHVTLCTILIIMLLRFKPLNNWVRWFLIVYVFAIALSTLFVKQHVFWDFPTGMLNGIVGYFVGLGLYKLWQSILQRYYHKRNLPVPN